MIFRSTMEEVLESVQPQWDAHHECGFSIDGSRLTALEDVAPRCVRKAMEGQLTRLLLGEGPDAVTLHALQSHVRAPTPQWAITLMWAPLRMWVTSHRMHDSVRDRCLLGRPVEAHKLEYYVGCMPP